MFDIAMTGIGACLVFVGVLYLTRAVAEWRRARKEDE